MVSGVAGLTDLLYGNFTNDVVTNYDVNQPNVYNEIDTDELASSLAKEAEEAEKAMEAAIAKAASSKADAEAAVAKAKADKKVADDEAAVAKAKAAAAKVVADAAIAAQKKADKEAAAAKQKCINTTSDSACNSDNKCKWNYSNFTGCTGEGQKGWDCAFFDYEGKKKCWMCC